MTDRASLATNGKSETSKRTSSEIMLRINSALILATISLLSAYMSRYSFAALIAVFVALMAWEWGRLVRGKGIDAAFWMQVLAGAVAAFLTAYGCPSCAVLIVIVVTAGVFALRRLEDGPDKAWWSAAGVYYAGFPAISLVWLRTDAIHGWHAILFLFVIVWTTDTAAYVFGKLIGGPKLAPRISPKKTWAGLIGATIMALIAGMLFAVALGGTSPLALGALGVALALIAQMGDLAESALKRFFGLKDSSGLIPGHGGVLDRLDGLVAAAVAAALIARAMDPANPGAGLLIW
jgi:phosphatidate cytidylyltransferase